MKACLCLSALISLFPFFTIFNSTTLTIVYGTLAMVVTLVFFYLVSVFLSCALLGLQRLAAFQVIFGSLIRLSDVPTGLDVVLLQETEESVEAGNRAAATLSRIRSEIKKNSVRPDYKETDNGDYGNLIGDVINGDVLSGDFHIVMSPIGKLQSSPISLSKPGKEKVGKRRRRLIAEATGEIEIERTKVLEESNAVMELTRSFSSRLNLGSELRVGQAMPRLSFLHEENLVAWCYARSVLLNFGARFNARLELVTWSCAVATFGMAIAMLSVLFGQPDASSQYQAFSSPFFRQAITSMLAFSVFLIAYTYMGACVNDSLSNHRNMLSSHLMRVREFIMECRFKAKRCFDSDSHSRGHDSLSVNIYLEHWENVDRVLSTAVQSVGASNDHQPFTVLGFSAHYGVPKAIASFTLSFVFTLATVFYTAYFSQKY